jgi:pimeloyl-[acyl-carrier protein] methyl ester esterase
MIEIHAYHGWGFDGHFWDNLRSEIPAGILFKSADRGYFGGVFEPEFTANTEVKVIFTHSFGLHWCPKEKINQANILVIFNGFSDFLPTDFFERRKEGKILKRMHDQFKNSPEVVLNAFYKNCFFPQKSDQSVPEWINQSLLAKDLIALKKTKFARPKSDLEIHSITGEDDQIASNERTEELIEQNRIDKSMKFNGFGHALPIVNSSGCWSYLIGVLPIFEEYANKNGFK